MLMRDMNRPANLAPADSVLMGTKELQPAKIGGNHNHNCLVCVIDDDLSILRATKRLLATEGWEVEVFSDPASFLQSAQSNSCGVAVLDILMPIMSGLEVQSRLREVSPSTRVIILTSVDDPAVRSRALESGAVAVLNKPINDCELLSQIQAAARSS